MSEETNTDAVETNEAVDQTTEQQTDADVIEKTLIDVENEEGSAESSKEKTAKNQRQKIILMNQ